MARYLGEQPVKLQRSQLIRFSYLSHVNMIGNVQSHQNSHVSHYSAVKICLWSIVSLIIESCYKKKLHRNNRKTAILWSFSYNSFVKFYGKKNGSHNTTVLCQNLCYYETCYIVTFSRPLNFTTADPLITLIHGLALEDAYKCKRPIMC